MRNPYFTQSAAIRDIDKELFPYGLDDFSSICEAIYDAGIYNIKKLRDHLTEKYGKDENVIVNAKAFNFINWLILRLPAKEEMKRFGLIF